MQRFNKSPFDRLLTSLRLIQLASCYPIQFQLGNHCQNMEDFEQEQIIRKVVEVLASTVLSQTKKQSAALNLLQVMQDYSKQLNSSENCQALSHFVRELKKQSQSVIIAQPSKLPEKKGLLKSSGFERRRATFRNFFAPMSINYLNGKYQPLMKLVAKGTDKDIDFILQLKDKTLDVFGNKNKSNAFTVTNLWSKRYYNQILLKSQLIQFAKQVEKDLKRAKSQGLIKQLSDFLYNFDKCNLEKQVGRQSLVKGQVFEESYDNFKQYSRKSVVKDVRSKFLGLQKSCQNQIGKTKAIIRTMRSLQNLHQSLRPSTTKNKGIEEVKQIIEQ